MTPCARLGRTRQEVPREWLGARAVDQDAERARRQGERAAAAGRPVWVEGSLAVWQGTLQDSWVAARLGEWLELCADEASAHRVTTADLVAVLSGLGRGRLDLAVLSPRRALEPCQLEGAVRALEDARSEGLVGASGLASVGGSAAVLANWRFADAFDAVAFVDPLPSEATALARERRASLVALGSDEPGADFVVRFEDGA